MEVKQNASSIAQILEGGERSGKDNDENDKARIEESEKRMKEVRTITSFLGSFLLHILIFLGSCIEKLWKHFWFKNQ